MRIGILNDLHLGHTGTGIWHNRLLFEHAEEAVQETVSLLNEKSLDMAIILGDVTNDGTIESPSGTIVLASGDYLDGCGEEEGPYGLGEEREGPLVEHQEHPCGREDGAEDDHALQLNAL